ncbi:MAG: hypothetical protein RLZZ416_87 [Candidatus Parcubacteria bacterium]|jgi:uncharacterized membrane protein (UPF0127 family)
MSSRNTGRLAAYASGVILALAAFYIGWRLFAYAAFARAPDDAASASQSPTTKDQKDRRTIQLSGETIRVIVADTPQAREIGLGGRSGLMSDEGMLFIFPKDGKYAFWMKGMRFSIDILWLSAEGRIVSMAQNVSPETYPRDFVPAAPARYVLEVSAGWVAAHRVRIGDIVRL